MRLPSRARSAVCRTLEVHRQGEGKPVRLADVTSATGISRRFLEQLAMALKSHSILRGICGRNGGYVLGRPANEITIGDVLRAVTGPVNLVTKELQDRPKVEFCDSRLFWMLLEEHINDVLDQYTIADITDEESLKSFRDLLSARAGGKSGEGTGRVTHGKQGRPYE